jgi:hypothetical protein
MMHMRTAAAAAVVPLARVNEGRHFLQKNQAMRMARVASSDTSAVGSSTVRTARRRNLRFKQEQGKSTPADHVSYDHTEGDYFPYFEAGPSGANDIQ